MDTNNNIFFILSITILYLPSIYIQSEYILKTHEKDLGIMIILLMPSIIIYYTYYLKFKILSIILILIFLPAIIISIEYLFEGCGYGIIVTSG